MSKYVSAPFTLKRNVFIMNGIMQISVVKRDLGTIIPIFVFFFDPCREGNVCGARLCCQALNAYETI